MQPIVTTYAKGRGLYAIWFHPALGFFNWTLMAWENYNAGHWSDYVILLNDAHTLGIYSGTPGVVVLTIIPFDILFERQFSGDPLTLQAPDPSDLPIGNGQSQGVNVVSINQIVAAAVQMALSSQTIVTGAAIPGVLTVNQMTTNLTAVLTGSFVGRSILWTAGNLANSGARIEGYDGVTKKLIYSAVPVAPAPGDPFVIV